MYKFDKGYGYIKLFKNDTLIELIPLNKSIRKHPTLQGLLIGDQSDISNANNFILLKNIDTLAVDMDSFMLEMSTLVALSNVTVGVTVGIHTPIPATSIAVNTAFNLLQDNKLRTGVILLNSTNRPIKIKLGSTVTSTDYDDSIAAGSTYSVTTAFANVRISGIITAGPITGQINCSTINI